MYILKVFFRLTFEINFLFYLIAAKITHFKLFLLQKVTVGAVMHALR